MEFKAEYDENGNLIIKPIIVRKGNDIEIHVPSLDIINKFKGEE